MAGSPAIMTRRHVNCDLMHHVVHAGTDFQGA
jgi:hypothetical protein